MTRQHLIDAIAEEIHLSRWGDAWTIVRRPHNVASFVSRSLACLSLRRRRVEAAVLRWADRVGADLAEARGVADRIDDWIDHDHEDGISRPWTAYAREGMRRVDDLVAR